MQSKATRLDFLFRDPVNFFLQHFPGETDALQHALAMLKVLYRREGPCAVVESAKHMVVAAAAVISQELGPAEAKRFLHVVGDTQGEPVH